jgi:DnaJ-class molecular chaperone
LAGPATPGCHECNGRGHTSVFSRDGYMTCDWCGGSGKEPETVAGSAAPSGDDDE